MKTQKKILFLILSVVLLLCCTVLTASAASGLVSFGVTTAVNDTQVQINWWENNGSYYLFLPADISTDSLTLSFSADCAVNLDGEEVQNGDTVSLAHNSDHTLVCNGKTYKITVLQSQNVPSLHIQTASGSMDAVHADKSHKEAASVVILDNGEVVLSEELDYIKGRGNATWTLAKKPYNIKFDSKIDLFGMGKAKKWSLLANHIDESLLRNNIALDLAENAGIPFTSKHAYADLFINNEYYGNYLICESVEIGETRVNIRDLEGDTEDANTADLDSYSVGGSQTDSFKSLKANTQKWVNIPNNPDDISGGYLLEYELPTRYVNEVSGFVTARNQTIVLKSPEYASEAQVKYISALYQEFEDAVFSATGYNSLGKHYTEYIDADSFATMYVFQEYVKNLDAGLTSFYIYKDADSDVFVAAPVWDFDNALGNDYSRYGMNTKTANGWWAGVIYHFNKNDAEYLPTILNALYRQDDFFALASEKWNTVFAPVLSDSYIADIDAFADTLTDAAVMNAIRWNSFETNAYAATKTKYASYVDKNVIAFMTGRKAFLNKGFADTSVRVFYNGNGGTGAMFNESALLVGETLTLPDCSFFNGLLVFDSWNTAADGSGTAYAEGSQMVLEDTNITLYAQWREIKAEDLNFFAKILNFFRDLFEKIRNFFENIF